MATRQPDQNQPPTQPHRTQISTADCPFPSTNAQILERSFIQRFLNRHYYESRFLAARSFGLMHKPGTLVWDGLRFRAKSYDGEDIQGELVVGKGGMPTQINVETIRNSKPFKAMVELAYGESLGSVTLPTFFVTAMLDQGGKRIPIEETHCVSLVFQNVHLTSDDLNPRQIFTKLQKPPVTLVTSNNESFYLKNGRRVAEGTLVSKDLSRRVRIVIIFVIGSSSAIFLFWAVCGRKRKQ